MLYISFLMWMLVIVLVFCTYFNVNLLMDVDAEVGAHRQVKFWWVICGRCLLLSIMGLMMSGAFTYVRAIQLYVAQYIPHHGEAPRELGGGETEHVARQRTLNEPSPLHSAHTILSHSTLIEQASCPRQIT